MAGVFSILYILLPPVAIFDQIQFSTHYKQWIVGTPRNVTYLTLARYDINPRVLDMFKISVANCPPRIHRQAGWQRLKSNCVGFQSMLKISGAFSLDMIEPEVGSEVGSNAHFGGCYMFHGHEES